MRLQFKVVGHCIAESIHCWLVDTITFACQFTCFTVMTLSSDLWWKESRFRFPYKFRTYCLGHIKYEILPLHIACCIDDFPLVRNILHVRVPQWLYIKYMRNILHVHVPQWLYIKYMRNILHVHVPSSCT